jgi:acetyltransferase
MMKISTLKYLFNPRSIAVLGREKTEGQDTLLVRNLIDGGFAGAVLPVNPHRHTVAGVLAYPDVSCLPESPELAILTTPLEEGPALISALGAKGTRAVLLINDERLPAQPEAGATLKQALLDAASPHEIRILGPDRLGIAIPSHGINATLSRVALPPGPISLLTQSASLMRAVLAWASEHHHSLGFSHLVSLGAVVDVDCSDVLDYLAQDPKTRMILLYVERIHRPRQFMSATRFAARLKPVIVLKPHRYDGRMVEEALYDAAAHRTGVLRVDTLEQLFNTLETLGYTKSVRKNRLLILGNSRSMALLASDTLIKEGGVLAKLSPATRTALASIVGADGHADNPVDLGDKAGFAEYDRALELLLAEPEADALLLVHVPTFSDRDPESARAMVERAARSPRLVLLSWVGSPPRAPILQGFQQARLAVYHAPAEAVQTFIAIAEYGHNQELLMETPASVPEAFSPDTATAHRLIATALAADKGELNFRATSELLAAYQIPMVATHFAATPEEAARLATELGGNVALKILSPAIRNRADVGGVTLDLEGPQEVFTAATTMRRRVQTLVPEAVLEGFVVQPMVHRRGAYEVTIGVRTGRDFKAGPVLFFGHGGTEAQVINDIAYAFPPLNMHLARELMSRTRLYALLANNPGRPANLDTLALTLLQVSQMVVDLGELVELDINPLRVDAESVLALSARVRIAPATGEATERLAIRPYPKEWEQSVPLPNGRTLSLRPILPEDEPALQALVRRLSPEDIRRRFFSPLRELNHSMAARLTQLDYDREIAFVLAEPGIAGQAVIWGLVNLYADPDREKAEYAILLDPTLRGLGLGTLLMRYAIKYARKRGIRELFGEVLRGNEPMLRLNQALGFIIAGNPHDLDLRHVSLAV